MARRKIGSKVEVEGHGLATVVNHGRDFFGVYTEVRLEKNGEVIKTHPANVTKAKKDDDTNR